jgi:hypothetical protein
MSAATDRASIVERLRAYADGVDRRDWAQVRPLFTEDATLDYSCVGGPVGRRDEVVDWLAEMLAPIACTQHLLANHEIVVEEDRARSRKLVFNPFVIASGSETPGEGGREASVALFGGHYDDEWVRADGGWRIASRRHVLTWRAGPVPGALVTEDVGPGPSAPARS